MGAVVRGAVVLRGQLSAGAVVRGSCPGAVVQGAVVLEPPYIENIYMFVSVV